MNEEEALAQLRDIHAPTALDAAVVMEFAKWPFAVLALVIGVILLARLWNRNQWRRRARAELSQILTLNEPVTQWAKLLHFAAELSDRSGRPVISFPQTTFMPPESISDAERAEFIAFLNAELER